MKTFSSAVAALGVIKLLANLQNNNTGNSPVCLGTTRSTLRVIIVRMRKNVATCCTAVRTGQTGSAGLNRLIKF